MKPEISEIERVSKLWLKIADDNYLTASAMLRSKRYNFCMFCCQQTIEAILKAVFIKIKGDRPPYIHHLARLVELCDLKLPVDIDTKMLKIDAHYIKARYMEDRFNKNIYNAKNANNLLKDTKEVMKWFLKNAGLEK